MNQKVFSCLACIVYVANNNDYRYEDRMSTLYVALLAAGVVIKMFDLYLNISVEEM